MAMRLRTTPTAPVTIIPHPIGLIGLILPIQDTTTDTVHLRPRIIIGPPTIAPIPPIPGRLTTRTKTMTTETTIK